MYESYYQFEGCSMSYFDTYMKRVNRYGSNPQERIQGKREHDFKVFMNKSPNLVRAWNNKVEGDSYKAVLQTKEYDQDEVTDYLLVPLDNEIPMGTIIYTEDSRHKQVIYEGKTYSARRWINYAIDPYTSAGYNRYTVVELESEISWVDEGIKYTAFAHATGGGSGARDKNINAKFRIQFSESGVYLPNKRYSIVMPTHPNMKKNMKVTLGNETWKITGFDSISVKGVSYVTLEETLTDEREDIPIANAGQLKNWTVTTDRGKDFGLSSGGEYALTLLFSYGKDKKTPNYTIQETDETREKYQIRRKEENKIYFYTKNSRGNTCLRILIDGHQEVLEIPFFIGYSSFVPYIEGGEQCFVGETQEYLIDYSGFGTISEVELDNNSAEIISRSEPEKNKILLVIEGKKIGKNKITIKNVHNEEKSFDFEVKSMWLGGDD